MDPTPSEGDVALIRLKHTSQMLRHVAQIEVNRLYTVLRISGGGDTSRGSRSYVHGKSEWA